LVIAKNAELLRQNGAGLEFQQEDSLERIERTAARLRRLLSGVRSYARADTELEREQLPLASIVDEVLQTLAPLIDERRARVAVESELPVVTGDRNQLVDLVQNLVSNAIKFGPPSGGIVTINAGRADGSWRIAVSDRGQGIAPEHYERIFEPFRRLREGAEHPGTGLGLAICKRVAQNHGGSLAVQGNLHGGATFVFALPAD
jgi:signal transduction histidine kinase